MRFSWTGLIVAPLLAPLLFSAALFAAFPGGLFLAALVPACVVSYGATLFLFLPALHLLAARWPMTLLRVSLLGLALGGVVLVPLTWIAWASSGPNSGPPDESFIVFLLRLASDPLAAICPVAGLLTAAAYWGAGTWRQRAG